MSIYLISNSYSRSINYSKNFNKKFFNIQKVVDVRGVRKERLTFWIFMDFYIILRLYVWYSAIFPISDIGFLCRKSLDLEIFFAYQSEVPRRVPSIHPWSLFKVFISMFYLFFLALSIEFSLNIILHLLSRLNSIGLRSPYAKITNLQRFKEIFYK